ncbi:MAG: DUF2478 domain-containing protein [Alphaproteobacteria bacterium]
MTHGPQPVAAALLYTPSTPVTALLGPFSEKLKSEGVRVGGIVQEMLIDEDGHKVGLDAIEVDTGVRIAINRPTKSDIDNHNCSLNPSALAETTGAIRRAISENMDLIVIEKFGNQEKAGDGLANEIIAAMAEGIPTVVLVPALSLEEWTRFTGGMADLLVCSTDALNDWWRSHRRA